MNTPVSPPTIHVRVFLDGVFQSHVVAFNTRAGWIKRMVQGEDGQWVPEEKRGVVHADCDVSG